MMSVVHSLLLLRLMNESILDSLTSWVSKIDEDNIRTKSRFFSSSLQILVLFSNSQAVNRFHLHSRTRQTCFSNNNNNRFSSSEQMTGVLKEYLRLQPKDWSWDQNKEMTKPTNDTVFVMQSQQNVLMRMMVNEEEVEVTVSDFLLCLAIVYYCMCLPVKMESTQQDNSHASTNITEEEGEEEGIEELETRWDVEFSEQDSTKERMKRLDMIPVESSLRLLCCCFVFNSCSCSFLFIPAYPSWIPCLSIAFSCFPFLPILVLWRSKESGAASVPVKNYSIFMPLSILASSSFPSIRSTLSMTGNNNNNIRQQMIQGCYVCAISFNVQYERQLQMFFLEDKSGKTSSFFVSLIIITVCRQDWWWERRWWRWRKWSWRNSIGWRWQTQGSNLCFGNNNKSRVIGLCSSNRRRGNQWRWRWQPDGQYWDSLSNHLSVESNILGSQPCPGKDVLLAKLSLTGQRGCLVEMLQLEHLQEE